MVSESGDIATWLRPTPTGLSVDRIVPVGLMPSDIDGPHNITVAPDGKSYYITIAHGTPFGSLWKMDAAGDSLLGRAQVELFPTTISLTPDGQYAFVANSDFHGDHPRVNVVSVIHTPTMTKITDIPACDMPHGVKVNHAGTRVYASCMHSDEILQLDVATFGISRRAKTGEGGTMASMPPAHMGRRPHPGRPAPRNVLLRLSQFRRMTSGSTSPAITAIRSRCGTRSLSGPSRRSRWGRGHITWSPPRTGGS